MGKTAKGAVWINEDMLSAYDYWQFWRNTSDADVGKFLRLFTELPLDEIARLEALDGAELNDVKKLLANEATTLCHGKDAAAAAEDTARKTFEEGGTGGDLPEIPVSTAALESGIPLIDLMLDAGLAASKGEARRLVRGGGARINDEQVKDEARVVSDADLGPEDVVKLSAGKKRHVLVRGK
jgi:tyrosyl-tRNA synthetase